MVQRNYAPDSEGKFYASYAQYYRGIPVEGMFMNIIGQYDVVLMVDGFVVPNLDIRIDTISQVRALKDALDYIGDSIYPWEVDSIEINYQELTGDSTATLFPKGELVIAKKHGDTSTYIPNNFKLCWHFTIEGDSFKIYNLYVDARTGDIFDDYDANFHDYPAYGNVSTYWNLTQNIETKTCGWCNNYKAYDLTRQISVGDNSNNDQLMKDNDNHWEETDAKRVTGTMLWAVQSSYNYFSTRFYRWDGFQTILYINSSAAGTPFFQPDNNYRKIYFGSSSNDHHKATLDIIGQGDFEAVSLMEGIGDIFGELIELNTLGSTDWIHGANDSQSDHRHFEEPTQDYTSAFPTLTTPDWYPTNGNWGSVIDPHMGGGLLRKWFYLLAFGGDPIHNGITYHVNGVGLTTATDIFYVSTNWLLWSNINYQQDAGTTFWWAGYNYGHCSAEQKAVVAAWKAVGINLPLSCGIIGPRPDVWNSTRGNQVKKMSDPDDNSSTYESKIDDSVGVSSGYYVWHYPSTWSATTTHNLITFTSFGTNPVTSLISVDYHYTYEDSSYVASDYMYIHFTDGRGGRVENQDTENKLTIYPNPSDGILKLHLSQFIKDGVAEVYDLNGKLIYQDSFSGQSENLSLTDLPNGNYFVKVISQDFIKVEKFVIIK